MSRAKQDLDFYATLSELALTLIDVENKLYKVKLVKTAHAVNAAKKQLGWEAAEKLTLAQAKKKGARL